MPFEIGDKVAYASDTGGGVITKIISTNLVEILSDDGFHINVPCKKLILENPEIIESLLNSVYPTSRSANKAERPSFKSLKLESKRDPDTFEINLHAEDLINDFTGITNSDIIVKQLEYFRIQMEKAFESRKRKITVIHGVGKGVLRKEIRYLLDGYAGVSYSDAPFDKYGYGATDVLLQ